MPLPIILNFPRARTIAVCEPSGKLNTLSTSAKTPYLNNPVVTDGLSSSASSWQTIPIGICFLDAISAVVRELGRTNEIGIVTPGNNTRLRVANIGRSSIAGSVLKAVASITIDNEFVVHDIKVIDGEKGFFIAMPSKKTADGEYRDIAHPINSTTRDAIQNKILEAYENAAAEEV